MALLQNMLNLHSYISNIKYNNDPKTSRPELLNSLLPVSDYVKDGISKLKKQELIDLANSLNKYVESKNKYIFNGKEIKLDNYQKKIVKVNPNNNIRIISGAGSGKTTTILCRIKYLLDNYITPDRIL